MILKGIVEETFGSTTVFRGYATLKSLASLSEAKEYQRPVYENRLEDIVQFIKDGVYRFFPELIFSLQFNDTSALAQIKTTLKQGSAILSDNIKIKKGKFEFQALLGDNPTTKVLSIEFPNDGIKPLNRIDGNHRLTAVDKILGTPDNSQETIELKQKIGNMIVPFCIILQTKGRDASKYETAFFHLINANSRPLTSEENLRTILDTDFFIDSEIQEILGNDALIVQKIIKSGIQTHCSGIADLIHDSFLSICLELIGLLKNEDKDVDKVSEAIKTVDRLYIDNNLLKSKNNHSLLTALLYYHITNKKLYSFFKEWVLNNHLFEIENAKVKDIISIFDKISEKKEYKLFVAMPYWSHAEINEYNRLYKEVCLSISKKANIELELIPIMRFRGKSQRIDQRLIDKINECDIFIADITDNNINVIFEVGYAESKNKPMILLKNESDKEPAPFDMDKLQYLPYPNKGYYNDIKTKVTGNLSEILRRDFKVEI